MTAPYDGGCVCGAVRYRLTGEPLTLYACHCTECQRHSGSSFALSMPVRRSALEVVHGTPRQYDVVVARGVRRRGRYCEACGTRLWGEPVHLPTMYVVRPGTLDDTTWLDPVAHLWMRSAQPWVIVSDDVLRFDTQPPDFGVLIDAWRVTRARMRR